MSLTVEFIMQASQLEPVTSGDFSFLSLFWRADWVVKAVMIILILASIWSWAIAVDKLITFFQLRRRATLFEETFWSGRTLEELASSLGQDTRDPMARVFAAAMREWEESKTGNRSEANMHSTKERIDRVMNLVVNRELAKAEGGLTVLATVGSASVFIGLFGTVWGIMNSFRALSSASSTSLSAVAPGIAEALIATAIGLFAAIPAVIAYNRYSDQVERLETRYDNFVDEFTTLVQRQSKTGVRQ